MEAGGKAGKQEPVYGPGGAIVAVMNGQTAVTAYVPLPGGGTAVYQAGSLAYYRHVDWQDSARLASTPGRSLYSATQYTAFGQAYAGSSSSPDLSFTGQDQTYGANQYNFLERNLSPIQGRWWTPDPASLAAADLSNPQTLNRYAYVAGTPLTATDPLGLETTGVGVGEQTENCLEDLSLCHMLPNGECEADGVTTFCDQVQIEIEMGAADICPDGQCDGYGVDANGDWVQADFRTFAGGTSGYFNTTDLQQSLWEQGGYLFDQNGWTAYGKATDPAAFDAQMARVNSLLVSDKEGGPVGPVGAVLEGGHDSYLCPGCVPGRYPGGLHIETIGKLVYAHADNFSPYLSPNNWTTSLWRIQLLEHFIVDVFYGGFITAFPN